MEGFQLPGSHICLGCGGLTFRNREDALCPRCAYRAEDLIEQIELEALDRDLNLMTEFEAYCRQRDLRATSIPTEVFTQGPHAPLYGATARPLPFGEDGERFRRAAG